MYLLNYGNEERYMYETTLSLFRYLSRERYETLLPLIGYFTSNGLKKRRRDDERTGLSNILAGFVAYSEEADTEKNFGGRVGREM